MDAHDIIGTNASPSTTGITAIHNVFLSQKSLGQSTTNVHANCIDDNRCLSVCNEYIHHTKCLCIARSIALRRARTIP